MILLTSTDTLQLVTREAANIDVHATWVDGVSSIASNRTNTKPTTATTTAIVAAPAVSTYRTVKSVEVYNRSTSSACNVTIQHADGVLTVQLIKCTIPPFSALHYDESCGFSVRRRSGAPIRKTITALTAPTVGVYYTQVLGEDYANANATANRLSDVQELGFPVLDGLIYFYEYVLMYASAATGTGARFCVNGPGSPTFVRSRNSTALTTTSQSHQDGTTTFDTPSGAAASSAATGSNIAKIQGWVQSTCDGLMFLRMASEVTVSAITVKAGSTLRWMRLI